MKLNILLIALIAATSISCKKSTTPVAYPTDGLISYFNFDDNLKDERGNTPEGVNTGAAPFITGVSGKAISFNGVDQKVTFSRKSYKNSNTLSVALWFKNDGLSGVYYFILCSDFGVASNFATAGLAISTTSTNSAISTFTPNTWTHLVGTYDGTDIRCYKNGVLVSTTNHPGPIYDNDRFLTLGYFIPDYWKGSIDDLFIYGKALSQAEVTQLYNLH